MMSFKIEGLQYTPPQTSQDLEIARNQGNQLLALAQRYSATIFDQREHEPDVYMIANAGLGRNLKEIFLRMQSIFGGPLKSPHEANYALKLAESTGLPAAHIIEELHKAPIIPTPASVSDEQASLRRAEIAAILQNPAQQLPTLTHQTLTGMREWARLTEILLTIMTSQPEGDQVPPLFTATDLFFRRLASGGELVLPHERAPIIWHIPVIGDIYMGVPRNPNPAQHTPSLMETLADMHRSYFPLSTNALRDPNTGEPNWIILIATEGLFIGVLHYTALMMELKRLSQPPNLNNKPPNPIATALVESHMELQAAKDHLEDLKQLAQNYMEIVMGSGKEGSIGNIDMQLVKEAAQWLSEATEIFTAAMARITTAQIKHETTLRALAEMIDTRPLSANMDTLKETGIMTTQNILAYLSLLKLLDQLLQEAVRIVVSNRAHQLTDTIRSQIQDAYAKLKEMRNQRLKGIRTTFTQDFEALFEGTQPNQNPADRLRAIMDRNAQRADQIYKTTEEINKLLNNMRQGITTPPQGRNRNQSRRIVIPSVSRE